MRTVHRFLALAGAAVVTIAVAACNNDNTAPATPMLSQAKAESIATTVVADVATEIETATLDGGAGATAAFSASLPQASITGSQSQCTPTKSPSPIVDTDKDGVPDSVRIDYSGCVLSFPLSIDTVSGTIDLVDPTSATADHSVKRVFTDFRHATVYLVSGKEIAVTQNGVQMASHDSTTLHSSETNFRTDWVYANGNTAEHVRTWESLFTADVPGSIQPNMTLPSGTWTVNGTSSWTRPRSSYSLTVTTNPPLHYNASCTVAPRFDAGTVTAVVMKGTETMTVTIQFTACGSYTVTRS